MRKNALLVCLCLVIFLFPTFAFASTKAEFNEMQVSGKVVDGYRILTIPKGAQQVHFSVFRGDYIKFHFDSSVGDPILMIPVLSVKETLSDDPAKAPYFKIKKSGIVNFSLGEVAGRIIVIDYREEHYREVTSEQAVALIEAKQPFILDVRTPREYRSGHLKNAHLIPVQDLKVRLGDISNYKDRDILVYCATGNRSTVASKILIDNGFNRVANLRHGIVQWARDKLLIVR
jgi:rhodanese-related sulfurtransferase